MNKKIIDKTTKKNIIKHKEEGKDIKQYKIFSFKFSIKRIRPVLDLIRYKHMFYVLGTLKASRFSTHVCAELFNFLDISTKHFLSINSLEYNRTNLKKIFLQTIYAVSDKKGKSRVLFRGRGKVNFINKTKSHLFCIIKRI